MSRARRNPRYIPTFDSMESRIVPDGNVSVSISKGVLNIVGDDLNNQISITATANKTVTVHSLDGTTTINNQLDDVVFSKVKGVAALMLDGDDVVQISGVNVDKAFNIYLGSGNDLLIMDHVTAHQHSIITGLDGDDVVDISNSKFTEKLEVSLGLGDDTLNVVNTTIPRKSIFAGGTGNDSDGFLNDKWGEDAKVNTFENKIRGAFPTAVGDTATVDQGGSVDIDVAANDIALSGTLDLTSITIVTDPTAGTVTVNGDGTVTYTQDGTSVDSDSFQYTITDSLGNVSNVATVTITVNAVVQAPVANDDTGTVATGGSTIVNVAANDTVSSGTLDLTSIVIVTPPANGTATANADGTVTYTHNGSATTSDSFTYTINDDIGNTSNVATVTITVGGGTNTAPVANNDTGNVTAGASVILSLLANDTDLENNINPNSIVIVQQPAFGTITVNGDGTVTYLQNVANPQTADSFTYTVSDTGGLTSNIATVSMTITLVG